MTDAASLIATPQDLFKAVRVAQDRQGWRRAGVADGTRFSCKYVTDDGIGCAIGCLIPRESYRTYFEGYSIKPLVDLENNRQIAINKEILAAAGISESLRLVARNIQHAHDDARDSAHWKRNFDALEKRYEIYA